MKRCEYCARWLWPWQAKNVRRTLHVRCIRDMFALWKWWVSDPEIRRELGL